MFMVCRVSKTAAVELKLGADSKEEVDVDLSWADGMIGVAPVFDTEEAALAYAPDANITELIIAE